MPPNFPSPTNSTGSRIGRNASAWRDPDGAGLRTPPAASINTRFPDNEAEEDEEELLLEPLASALLLPLIPPPPLLLLQSLKTTEFTSFTIASTMSVSEAM